VLFSWDAHIALLASSLALLSEGMRMVTSRAMIAMTTSSSIKLKAPRSPG
jgi:hypothetical protein